MSENDQGDTKEVLVKVSQTRFQHARQMIFGDQTLSQMNVGNGWEYAMPSPSNPDMFQAATDSNVNSWYRRVPEARFITEGIATDCYDKGYRIPELKEKNEISDQIVKNWTKLFIPQMTWAHTLSRLHGRSILILGFNDLPINQWDKPVDYSKAKLKYTLAVNKINFNVTSWKFPENPSMYGQAAQIPENLMINGLTGMGELHPDRYIYMEHPDLLQPDNHGVTVLEPVADSCQVKRNVIFSVGQGLFRAVVGLLNITHPKTGVTAAQKSAVMGSFSNLHSRTVTSMPEGWGLKAVDLGGKGLASAWKNNGIVSEAFSVGSRVPVSVLQGSPRGAFGGAAKDSDLHDYYQTISAEQVNYSAPWIRRGLEAMKQTGQAKLLPKDFSIEFNPIFKQSFSEKASDLAGEAAADLVLEILNDGEKEQQFELLKLFMSTGGLS